MFRANHCCPAKGPEGKRSEFKGLKAERNPDNCYH